MIETEDKGISLSYTHFRECSGYKNWFFVLGDRLNGAKRMIELEDPYHLADAFSQDKVDRYLRCGILIEFKEASTPTLKDGWSIRLRCESSKKDNLEETIKHFKLSNKK
jgi:hypothetical protein